VEIAVRRICGSGRRWVGVAVAIAVCLLASKPAPAAEPAWISLFDGKTLDGWRVTDFGGPPEEVHVDEGKLILEMGSAAMSGVTRTREVPKIDYEVQLEAMRMEGSDIFCGLTFPVNDAFCSLIVGGWGGSLIGISSFDGMDASENETTTSMEFESGRWYAIRLRVTAGRLQAWIGDRRVVDARPGERRIAVRGEMENSKPFGFATWHTKAALREIRLRPLSPAEIKAAREE
jgi:hypothetical protein